MKRVLAIVMLLAATYAVAQTPKAPQMPIGDLRTRLWTIEQMIAGGRLEEAQRSIDILRTEAGDELLIDGLEGYLGYRRHDYSNARDILTKALKAPDAPPWWKILLAMCQYAMGDEALAKETVLKAQNEDAHSATEAIRSMGAAAADDVQFAPSVAGAVTLGFLLRTIGARSKELATLDIGLTKFPKDPRLELARLNLLVDAGADEKTVVGAADKGAADLPDNDTMQGLAGQVYARYAQFDKAAVALQKAVNLNRANYQARLDLGAVYLAQKKQAESERELTSLISAAPPPSAEILVQAHATLGSVLSELKRWKEAAATFERGQATLADNSTLLNNWAWLLATAEDDTRNPKRAIELATKAVALSRQRNSSMIDTLAEAYFSNGEKDKAIEYERKAIAMVARDDYKRHLARYQGLPEPPPTPPPAAAVTPPVVPPAPPAKPVKKPKP